MEVRLTEIQLEGFKRAGEQRDPPISPEDLASVVLGELGDSLYKQQREEARYRVAEAYLAADCEKQEAVRALLSISTIPDVCDPVAPGMEETLTLKG